MYKYINLYGTGVPTYHKIYVSSHWHCVGGVIFIVLINGF